MPVSIDTLRYVLVRLSIGILLVGTVTVLICLVIQWQNLLLYGIALQYAGMVTLASGILMMIGQGRFLTMLSPQRGDYAARTQQQLSDKQASYATFIILLLIGLCVMGIGKLIVQYG